MPRESRLGLDYHRGKGAGPGLSPPQKGESPGPCVSRVTRTMDHRAVPILPPKGDWRFLGNRVNQVLRDGGLHDRR
jgi:hypothetical protein